MFLISTLHPLYDSKKVCLNCKKEFPVKKVRSKYYTTQSVSKDFKINYNPVSIMVEPFLYNIYVCEHCGFSFNDKFSNYFKFGVKDLINDKISSNWVPRNYFRELDLSDGVVMYNLAIYSANLKEETSFVLGSLYLNLSWIYKDLGDFSNYKRSCEHALKHFLFSFSSGDYSKFDFSEYYVLYLISYLNYVLENYKDSSYYLSKVISGQTKIKNKILLDNALSLWDDLRSLSF